MARIARGPLSNTNSRTPRIPAVATAAQMAIRHSHGNATANHVTKQASVSHANHAVAATREGSKSIRLQELAAQRRATGIGWDITRQQIARHVRIGQFQKLGEGGAFIACRERVSIAQIPQQQEVELFHAAPALPLKLAVIHALNVQLSAGDRSSSS
jgi:hypothetical protein